MSDILCRWLNQDLRLSKTVEPKTFAKDFSSGYLIGEVLHKYQLQNDFSMFMKKDTSISRLNNFTRLEPTLQLLGISFDINTAQELMQEKQGVATRLLYQLYISLEKKKSTEISGTMMEIMLPAANAELHKKEHDIYSDRLHQVVKRDAEIKLQKISQHYEKKFQQLNEKSVVTHSIQQKRQLKVQYEKRMKNIEKRRVFRQKHGGIMSWIQATAVQVPRPPPNNSQIILKKRLQQQQRRQQQAQKVQIEIAQFEINRKKLVTTGFASFSSGQSTPGDFPFAGQSEIPESGTKMILQSSSKYIEEIRQRLEENAVAREQREKRRDRFLVEQLKAHEAQEEARREEQLVKRLTRQTQQEQRLAAQLLQIRMQKEVIRENRLFREQQYQQRRERDFQEALAREAALAQQAKLDHAEEIRKEVEFFNRIAAERAQRKYQKHFKSCKDILDQIVDLATKVGEYRLLTGNLIPEKLMREWKELLFSGLPLYEPIIGQQPGFEFSSSLDPLELKKQETLNNQDYDEYTNMVDEWAWPEEEAGATTLPPTNNNILGHIIQRLRNIVHPPVMEPSSPSFPHFTLKACVLGKFCSGKTTCLAKIAKAHGIYVLSADRLIKEALNSYRRGEEVTEQQGEKTNEQLLTSSSSVKSDPDTQEEGKEGNIKLSILAMQGAAAEKELRNCSGITNELLVGIIVEAIRQLPAHSGWILDGFPVDITQAYLLEKAMGGSVDIGNDIERSRTNLAADPNPLKPPLPAPVLDLALLLDIPDESVIIRAFNHTDSSHPTDKTLYLAQIPDRITAFQDTWPKLEKWFGEKQNILVCVDASVDEEELYRRVDSVLQHVLMQTQKDLASNLVEDLMDKGKATGSSSSATRLSVDQDQPVTDEAPAEKAQSVMSLSKSNTHSPRGTSEKASTSSVTNEDSQEVPKNPSEAASPYPCLSSWAYVDEPLPLEVSEYLCSYWDTVCDSYVNNIKTVMQQLRSQHTDINHHLFNIREKFKHFLHRPDLKQELVSQWQNDFNSIADDMREDGDTKADLHVRLDELRERLWDISDKSKEQDQQKRADIMGSSWLEEHTALLIKHHSTLMKVELDRFQETLSVLRVYYMSMYKPVLPEPPSNFACIPLLDNLKIKDQDKSIPALPRRPDSSGEASKSNELGQIEPVKPSQEKLVSDYEEALRAIGNLMSAEAHQQEMDTAYYKVKNKIHKEYAVALDHEENAAKVRIALVKGHGLKMLHSLKSRAEQTFSSMEEWLEAHYLAEMKGIEQLSEVVQHHIEAGNKLQNELVLECTDFYLNGDCQLVASQSPPPRPPPLEKPSESTLTITQLESLHQQLSIVAPSGLIPSSEFSGLLRDIISVNRSRNTLPELWLNKNETQWMEIVYLLTDDYELIDWRRFLLSAALPWPVPSLSQLLVVLRRFKAADPGKSGYINEKQYLQTELWFSFESVQPIPEDPSEPPPYDRLANLHKFFFQLFADHSISPPQLDYVSMLQYFAANPNPRQGFIRALCVALGKHLKHSSPCHLVKSMPRIEEASELDSSEVDVEYKEEETQYASQGLPGDQEVSIPVLLTVIGQNITKTKDSDPVPPGCLRQQEHTEHLVHVFKDLGYKPEDCVPFSVLCQHPFIQSLMETSTRYQLINIHTLLLAHQNDGETDSLEGF